MEESVKKFVGEGLLPDLKYHRRYPFRKLVRAQDKARGKACRHHFGNMYGSLNCFSV
jgi:hypothetical protein